MLMRGALAFFAFLGLACQQGRLEKSTPPSAVGIERSNESESQESQRENDEKVSPPVPIAGVWLTGHIMEEEVLAAGANIKIGVISYLNGQKVVDDPNRYRITLSVSATNTNMVNVMVSTTQGSYDHSITLSGPSLELIRQTYTNVSIEATIVDTSDFSSATNIRTVADILAAPSAVSSGNGNGNGNGVIGSGAGNGNGNGG